MNRGLFTVGSLGLPEDLTYSAENLGISTESVLKRKDGPILQQLLVNLSKYTKVVHEDWVGTNFLPTTASSVGSTFLGLASPVSKINDLSNIEFFYGVGVDDPSFYLNGLKKDCFSVFQTAFSNPALV